MSGKRRIIILTKRQQAKPVFSSCYSFGESGDKIKTGRQIKTGEQTPSLRRTLARAFSPPLAPSFVAAVAALKVSLWRRMSAVATGNFILTGGQRRRTGRQHPRCAELSLAEGEYHCFSGFARKTFRTSSLFTITYNFSLRAPLSFSRCVFAERKRILK